MPSALIPICGYKSSLETLGTHIPGLSFPVCSAFQPTLLRGQLCYSLDLGEMKMRQSRAKKTEQGKENGILIIVDPNLERSEPAGSGILFKLGSGKNILNLSPRKEHGNSASVHIHTLVR